MTTENCTLKAAGKVFCLPVMAVAVAIVSSCKKTTTPPPAAEPDVYVAGQAGGSAMIWKNGVVTALTDGTIYGMANSVFVK